jgi:hypothetical protein
MAYEDDRRELLELHEAERRGHLQGDAGQVLGRMADPWVYVRAGGVQQVHPNDAVQRLSRAFDGVTHHQWEDLQDPMVQISRDGSMAWMITQVGVHRSDVNGRDVRFVYAGIDTYEKRDGAWTRIANVSTFGEE